LGQPTDLLESPVPLEVFGVVRDIEEIHSTALLLGVQIPNYETVFSP
jgi:hypothetical protein